METKDNKGNLEKKDRLEVKVVWDYLDHLVDLEGKVHKYAIARIHSSLIFFTLCKLFTGELMHEVLITFQVNVARTDFLVWEA